MGVPKLFAGLVSACLPPVLLAGVSVMSLDGTWSFLRARAGAARETVSVPHDWAIDGPFDRKLSSNTAMLPWKGSGRYRRTATNDAAKTSDPVYVYTSGDEAELFLNGVSLGRRRKSTVEPKAFLPPGAARRCAFAESFRDNPYYDVTDRYRLRWPDVEYAPGTLTAVAYRNGRRIGETKVETVGEPTALAIDAERSETPQGTFFVHVRPVDAAGRIVRFGSHRVSFSLTGPGRIVAAANGDPTELTPFSSVASYPMLAGCVSVVIRPERGRDGPIALEVSAEGLGRTKAVVRGAAEPEVLLEVGPSETVARASEGDLVVLRDGRWLLGYSEFPAKQSGRYAAHHDHAKARIVTRVSSDAGRTWSAPTVAAEPGAGDLNVMSVSFLRLSDGRLALFYMRKRAESDGRPVMRVSADEGETWGAAQVCVDEAHRDYYVLNNARAVRLSTGRIVLPLCRHSVDAGDPQGFESEGRLCVAASDDDGKSWRMICEPFKVFDRLKSRVTVQEPGIVELKDGRLLMYARTNRRAQWGLWSSDGGATWSKAEPLPLVSPNLAPATIARLKDGNLVAVWNDYSGKSADPDRIAFAEQRDPFSIAWSKDEGRTWSPSRTIEADPPGSRPNLCCCYFAVREIGEALHVFHCHHDGLKVSHLTKVPLAWVYAPTD